MRCWNRSDETKYSVDILLSHSLKREKKRSLLLKSKNHTFNANCKELPFAHKWMQLRYSFLNKLNNGKMKLVQASLRKQLSTKGRDCQFTWKRKRILLYMNADESFLKRGGHIQMRPNRTSPRNSAFFMVSDLKIQIEWLLIQTSYEEVASSSKSNTQTFQYQIVKTLKLMITITRNHLVTIAYFKTIAIFSSSWSHSGSSEAMA